MPPINHKAEIESAAQQATKTIADSADSAAMIKNILIGVITID
jgi:hypothetical protein